MNLQAQLHVPVFSPGQMETIVASKPKPNENEGQMKIGFGNKSPLTIKSHSAEIP